jgi:hypothetical protein
MKERKMKESTDYNIDANLRKKDYSKVLWHLDRIYPIKQ